MNYRRSKVLLLLLLLCPLMQRTVFSQEQVKLSINKKNISLQEALQEVEKQSNLSVALNESKLDKTKKINIELNNKSLDEVLNLILQGTNLGYKKQGNYIIIIPNQKQEQNQKEVFIKGHVKDDLGEALIGVSISFNGGGIITNLDGDFEIETTIGSVLSFSYVGFLTKQITIQNEKPLTITLEEDSKSLDEVVVTALGIKRSEKSLSYNVQQVSSESLTKVKEVNFVNSLNGKVAGVTINRSASGVGGATRVVMRGTKSLVGDNNVLYVIDGIPLGNSSRAKNAGQFSAPVGGEGISDFNNEDIESISVLTGPSAAALYGASAANGVVLINTKKGKEGKVQISISNNTEFFTPFIQPTFQNRYGNVAGNYKSWGDKLATPSNFNPMDFFKTGANIMDAFSLSVGNKTNQTFLSLANTNSKGSVPNNKYYRYNFTVRNTTTFWEDKLSIDLGASYILQGDQNMTSQGQYHNPLLSLYLFPRGEDFEQVKIYERFDAERNFPVQYWPYGDQGLSLENPYWITNREMFFSNKKRYMFHANIKYDILSWMNIASRVRVDNTYTDQEKKLYASTHELYTNSKNGSYSKNRQEYNQTYADVMLNIDKQINDFNLTVNLGGSSEDHNTTSVGIGGRLFNIPNLFSASNFYPDTSGASQDYDRRRNLALFASMEVGYKSMVYLTLTGRNDWASQLVGSKEPSFFYPSVGTSFILSEIFKLPKQISYMKLRASYTEVGSPISQLGITPGTITYPIIGGTVQPNAVYPFPDFKAERTKSYEFGANVRLFENRINVNATLYQSNTYNQTFQSQLPPSSGYSSFYVQAGNVRNMGVELSLGYNDTYGPLAYTTNFTYTANENKIIEMVRGYENPVDKTIFDIKELTLNGFYLREGDSMTDIYTVGILQRDRNGELIPESDGYKVDKTQRIKIGSSSPKFNMGWMNSFQYKNFDFSFLINARVGGIVTSTTQAFLDEYGVSEASAVARDNGGVMLGEKMYDAKKYYNTIGGQKLGAYYTYSATNVRLQELSLSYAFPRKLFNNKIERLSLSLTASNLFMLYNKAPYDPEIMGSTGTYSSGDFFMFPSQRSLGFGLKIQL